MRRIGLRYAIKSQGPLDAATPCTYTSCTPPTTCLGPDATLSTASRLARRLLLVERVLVRQPLEHAYAFTSEGRLIVHLTSNKPDTIDVPASQEPMLRGAIFTHNHPLGRSLSEQDLEFAMLIGLSEIRAVTRHARYAIRAAEQGWPYLRRVSLRREVARQKVLLIRDLRRNIVRGLISEAQAEMEFEHRLWSRMAELGLMAYSVEPWPGK